jgi:hypothetical protein
MEEEKQEEKARIELSSIIPKEILSGLREEFPKETHESKKMDDNFVQTGIKPAYITERLNQVLGVDGWEAEELEVKVEDKDIATKVKLTLFTWIKDVNGVINKVPIISRSQWGSARRHTKGEFGDALKSAYTNGICKCASLFDVAHDAYKGLLAPVESSDDLIDENEAAKQDKKKATKKRAGKGATKTEDATAPNTDLKAIRKELLTLFTQKGLTRNELQGMMKDQFGKEESRQLNKEEMEKLVAMVKELPDEPHTNDGTSNPEEVAAQVN